MDTGRGGWRASGRGGTDPCALESVVSLPVRVRKDAVLVAQAAVALDGVGGGVLDGGVRSPRRVLDGGGRGDAPSAYAGRCSKDRARQLHRGPSVRSASDGRMATRRLARCQIDPLAWRGPALLLRACTDCLARPLLARSDPAALSRRTGTLPSLPFNRPAQQGGRCRYSRNLSKRRGRGAARTATRYC
jgi:hypothetical protein